MLYSLFAENVSKNSILDDPDSLLLSNGVKTGHCKTWSNRGTVKYSKN